MLNIAKEVASLRRLTTGQLRDKYAEVFGEATHANHRVWLIKRIAWRLQVQVEGDLSERARQRAKELANEADLRLSPPALPPGPPLPMPANSPSASATPTASQGNQRILPGTVLTRLYKGQTLQVTVRADGFEFEGIVYPSLSAVAKTITGSHTSGVLFFRLNKEGATR